MLWQGNYVLNAERGLFLNQQQEENALNAVTKWLFPQIPEKADKAQDATIVAGWQFLMENAGIVEQPIGNQYNIEMSAAFSAVNVGNTYKPRSTDNVKYRSI